ASLYSCVMYGRRITDDHSFIVQALTTIRDFMEDDGQAFVYQKFTAQGSGTISFAKALNRQVTGSMSELVTAATDSLESSEVSPHDVGFELNDLLLSAVATDGETYGRPRDAFRRLADTVGGL